MAQRFLDAITEGDIDAARACFAEDAEIWHNFDGITQTVDENLAMLGWMVAKAPVRDYVIHRLEEIEGGYLQQHTLRVVMNDGTKAETEAIVIVGVRDGLIARIDEWLDPRPLAGLAQQADRT